MFGDWLTIIIGAGTSHDCADSDENVTTINNEYRPPLTKELFKNSYHFSRVLQNYPKAEGLSDEIRTQVIRDNVSIEHKLRELSEEKDILLKKEYLEIPLYFQQLLWEVSNNFIDRGATKFQELIRLLQRSSRFKKILILSLNYDLFVEQAMQKVLEYSFESTASYIQEERKIVLVKLHGSVNWVKRIINKPKDGVDASDYLKLLHSIDDELKLSTSIKIVDKLNSRIGANEHTGNMELYYPAMVVPIEGKDGFSCPDNHVGLAKSFLKKCNNFLIMGFSAQDKEVLELLTNVSDVNNLKIVNNSNEGAYNVLERIQQVNNNFLVSKNKEDVLYTEGFQNFVKNGDLNNFLSI